MADTSAESDVEPSSTVAAARALLAQGRFYDAEALLSEAINADPENPGLYICLALAFYDQGRFRESLSTAQQAVAIDPSLPAVHFILGSCYVALLNHVEAIKHFELCLEQDPKHFRAIIAAASSLERVYRFDDAAEYARQILQDDPENVAATVILARCLRNTGRPEDAIGVLDQIKSHVSEKLIAAPEASHGYYMERAFCLLDLQDIESAVHLIERCNKALMAVTPHVAETKTEGQKILWRERRHVQELAARIKMGKRPEPELFARPQVFVTGFPRSGTTLLRSILASHPKLAVFQESSALTDATATLPAGLSLDSRLQKGLPAARSHYYAQLKEASPDFAGRTVVDIHPFNSSLAAWMVELFPHAKLVLMVRHPCDACLSAYMQYFHINGFTAGMLTLEDTIQTYSQLMSFWNDTVKALSLDVLTVRYEDVVADFEPQVSHLLNHIGVDWDSKVEAFNKTAKADRPKTASSHQVIKPLYDHASYRWKRCREILEPHFEVLAPFVEAYGYDFD